MPVTVYPSKKPLAKIGKFQQLQRVKESRYLLVRRKPEEVSPASKGLRDVRLLNALMNKRYGYDEVVEERCGDVIQSSFCYGNEPESPFDHQPPEATTLNLAEWHVSPAQSRNGLLGSVLAAYNEHHHLILRPDDIWLAILTQLSFFINGDGKAEELRSRFVSHKGKAALEVKSNKPLATSRIGDLTQLFPSMLEEQLLDKGLRDWMIPSFTTTTETDKAAASIIMMAIFKSYFKYQISLACGLPAVTLLGEKNDWESLAKRAELLASYGPETSKWQSLLIPVLKRFVTTFEEPTSQATLDFWNRITHHQPEGSHASYLSGWITAFCFFDRDATSLYTEQRPGDSPAENIVLDGVVYHQVNKLKIPPSYASVPVKLVELGVEIPAYMVAGSVGIKVCDSGMEREGHDGKFDSVQPVVGCASPRQAPQFAHDTYELESDPKRIKYRLVPLEGELLADDMNPESWWEVVESTVLTVNLNVQPPSPALPRVAGLPEKSALANEWADFENGFLFYQIGKLQNWMGDAPPKGDEEASEQCWSDTEFTVVVRIDILEGFVGLWV